MAGDAGRPSRPLRPSIPNPMMRTMPKLRTRAPLLLGILACVATLLAAPMESRTLEAQTPEELRRMAEQELGRPVSDEEILRRLQASGLSAADIRRELERRGQDPAAADPWLDVLEGRSSAVPAGTSPAPLVEILNQEAPSEVRRAEPPPPVEPDPGPPIFGRELFRRATTEFQPLAMGPAPPGYRVGPGDELILVLTGDVEQAYELTVSREGWVVIPDVGQITVQGRTMEGVRDVLFQRLSARFSGLRRGPDATTFFDVSLGRLRTNEVFVIGDVERPAAYTVGGLATALTALYQAGGPSRSGSFREIRVNRGGEVVATIDLYRYLLEGRAHEDLRLEHGDIVFVPPARHRVELSGAVVRPGIYELRAGEDLRSLLRMSGGVDPAAELRQVQVARILPLEERAPGRDRVLLDIPVRDLDQAGAEPIPLQEGDRISVFAVLDDAANQVRVSGAVWRPGDFGLTDGTRLWEVLDRAGGLLPDVVEGRAQIQRLQDDWTRRLIPVTLGVDREGRPLENPVLEAQDEILVYAARDLREEGRVSIGGWVREPGVYPHLAGMTVADLVLMAGGLRTGAYLERADVSRVVRVQERTDTLTETLSVPLDSALVFDGAGGAPAERAISSTAAADFPLENLDAVFIRRAPGFEVRERVVVSGEVAFPGPYSITTRSERLSELLERAGGLTPEAYPEGVQLWRASRDGTGAQLRVGVDLPRVLSRPGDRNDLLLEPGDSIHVPSFIPTVEVRGAVAAPTLVLHRPGAGVDHYIRQAGGYLQRADERRVRLQFANGEVATRGRGFLFFRGRIPRPDPGAVIVVPEEDPSDGVEFREVLAIVTSTATAVGTILLAVSRF
ncbi:MAG: hypothetical protein EA422_00830 [Gemmatimonadales bacterium]|nr:MAG: hypothetical protein EA422_00830 [Gemmatimonadales bacterium]